MIQNSLALIKSYGLKSDADFKGKIMEMSLLGTQIKIGNNDFHRGIRKVCYHR